MQGIKEDLSIIKDDNLDDGDESNKKESEETNKILEQTQVKIEV